MLVIFDCDGVLVDTEELCAQVFSQTLQSLGILLSTDECLKHFKGKTLSECYRWLEQDQSHRLPDGKLPSDFPELLDQATYTALAKSTQAIEGVTELVGELKNKNIAYCVASNGGHKKIRCSLSCAGLWSYFSDLVFSAEDVKQGKPAPDLFLYAAEAIGVPARFCYVIEDSLSGVQAARAAGMNVIAFSPEADSELEIDDQVVLVSNMGDVEKILLKT
ncbi:HAD family phosphatase [Teredinibacter sp. KSP-S5-2]|uniref:HAD family hydrolase n=1 Tax=Teredinibacter sp. KSP-S5-2 TaxID=3034506 RepID=UPI002934BBE9|nr:HAD family phosphatase [Teredinibacter sp. KSP-S5-2]WNO09475.1 HAD family phosphatase [Teredinibacter sp. KSP-S5-2]